MFISDGAGFLLLWGAFSSCNEQRCVGFALQRLLLLWSMGSGLMGSVVGAHRECWIQLLQCGTDHYPDLKSPLIKTRKNGFSFFFCFLRIIDSHTS